MLGLRLEGLETVEVVVDRGLCFVLEYSSQDNSFGVNGFECS